VASEIALFPELEKKKKNRRQERKGSRQGKRFRYGAAAPPKNKGRGRVAGHNVKERIESDGEGYSKSEKEKMSHNLVFFWEHQGKGPQRTEEKGRMGEKHSEISPP